MRCIGCVTLKEEQDTVERDGAETAGLYISLVPNPEFEGIDG